MFSDDDIPHHLLVEVFPNCEIRSAPTPNYNCVTWAIHEEETISQDQQSLIWWPSDTCYWPDPSLDDSLEAFEKVF